MEEKKLTGYPSIDKPWQKYFPDKIINAPLPESTIYEYLWESNKHHLDDIALEYFGRTIKYGELFSYIESTEYSFERLGIKQGEIVALCMPNTPEGVIAFYSFICGIVTNLPISVLFNFLDMDVSEMPYKWLCFTLHILLLVDTLVMTVAVVRFTLLHIEINEKARREKVSEACTNLLYQQVFSSMKILRKTYWMFVISFFLFVLFVIVLFAINNFDFSWLLDAIHNTVEPPVTP